MIKVNHRLEWENGADTVRPCLVVMSSLAWPVALALTKDVKRKSEDEQGRLAEDRETARKEMNVLASTYSVSCSSFSMVR